MAAAAARALPGIRLRPSRNIKVVSFDVTGTLIQYVGSLGFYFGRALERHAKISDLQPRNMELGFKKAYAATKAEFPNFGARSALDTQGWWRKVVQGTFHEAMTLQGMLSLSEKEIEPVFQEIYHVFETTEPYAVYPDVLPSLSLLKRENYRIAVISNTDERYRTVLDRLGVLPYIDYMILSRERKEEKPSPEVYRLLLREAAVRGEEVLHIGDSYTNDYMGPKGVGMHSLRCFRHGEREREQRGEKEVTNMQEIIEWLREKREEEMEEEEREGDEKRRRVEVSPVGS